MSKAAKSLTTSDLKPSFSYGQVLHAPRDGAARRIRTQKMSILSTNLPPGVPQSFLAPFFRSVEGGRTHVVGQVGAHLG